MLTWIEKKRILRAASLAALVLLACGITAPQPPPTGTDPAATASSAGPADGATEPQAGPAPTTGAPTPTAQTPTIEISLADGSVIQAPAPGPIDYYDLLRDGVADGTWTDHEGTLILLRLLAGELDISQVPGADSAETRMGTGVVNHALDLLEDPVTPAEVAVEIERLLAVLAPDRATLDAVSRPVDEISSLNGRLARPAGLQGPSCSELEALGYETADVQPGQVCFIFILLQMEGQDYRVYYPVEWEDDEARKIWVDETLNAIIDTIPVYAGLGEVRPANIVFSQRTEFPTGATEIGGYQISMPFDQDCSVTMYMVSTEHGADFFKQMIAHELFHCFQDWNLFKKPYAEHAWWGEGTAEYFSNVVYPAVNYEHRATEHFNLNSLDQSLMEMTTENFAFFQHLANHIGNQGVIDLLEEMSFAGGRAAHAAHLADISYMPGLFQDLFVTFASTGIPDSGGGVIAPDGVAVREVRTIDEEADYDFEAEPWVGARYALSYEREKRFVQEAEEDGEGNYGMVLAELRRDRSAWSSLPEEVRSSCEEDSSYLLVTTIVEASYTFTAAVSEVEVAECDPCLLGAWDMDLASFEGYMQGVFESLGEGGFEMDISGHYYLHFMEEGRATSLRDDLTIRIPYDDPNADPTEDSQTLAVVINAHGEGEYTADGETLTMLTWLEVTDDSTAYIGDGQFVVQLEGGMVNTSLFGQSGSAEVGIGPSEEESENEAAPYTCSNATLEITRPEGTIRFLRIEEIPPTAVPTEFPEGNPEP